MAKSPRPSSAGDLEPPAHRGPPLSLAGASNAPRPSPRNHGQGPLVAETPPTLLRAHHLPAQGSGDRSSSESTRAMTIGMGAVTRALRRLYVSSGLQAA